LDSGFICFYFKFKRGEALENKGFGMYDALHVACAEQGQADVFLTTDDKLRRLGIRYSPQLWFQEKINESTSNDIRTDSEAKVFANKYPQKLLPLKPNGD
jgi:predicted nucleic acid-binding protein